MSENHRSDIIFVFAVAIAIYLAYQVRDVLILIYVSALFAVVLSPAIKLVRKLSVGDWRPSRAIAIMVLLFGLGLLLLLFFVFAVPPIYRDARDLAKNWPSHAASITAWIRSLPFAEDFNPGSLQLYSFHAVGGAFGLFRGLAGGIFGLFSAFVMISYFILDGDRAFAWAVSLFPKSHQPRLVSTMLRAERRVRHWLVGQGLLMVILGVSSFIAFGLIGVRYFYVLAVFAAITNIAPVVGVVLSATLSAAVALIDFPTNPTKVLLVLLFYGVYLQVENAYLTPRIMKSTVDLPPLAVLIALVIGGAVAGVLGAMVAVPTAGLIAVIVDEYLVNPHLPLK